MVVEQMNFSHQQSACIQNIIFKPIIKKSDPLFICISKSDDKIQKFSTDTYINIFHYKRWSELTGYNNFFLNVECRGIGKICLYGYSQNKKNTIKLINFYNLNDKINYKLYKFDINGEYDFYFLSWENDIDNELKIQKAYYGIKNINCCRKIKIAIVSTTYNRLDDVKFLIKSYSQACKSNNFFEEASHLFIVNNNYNDKNFFLQYETENISIINNKNNYGGSGGFAQGAKLAVESGEFTHILFMDDDALVYEESWFRSIALLRYLREDLREHPVSAAMFTREIPTYCHAMIEGLNVHLHRLCLSGATSLDGDVEIGDFLSKAHETCFRLRLDKDKPPYPYAAWWYCIYPVEVFIQHGYPAPYFFCGDDIEYGLRIKKSPLFLNGVCVWHPAFENKWSPLREYLSLRNYALRCATHMKGWRYELIKTFLRKMARCLAANDYERGALTILALNDFLDFEHVPREGRQLITRVETERLRWANKTQAIGYCPHKIEEKYFRYNILPMFYVFLTLGGVLVPSCFRHRNTIASFLQVGGRWASQWTAYDRQKFSRRFNNKYAIKLTIITFIKLIYIQMKNKNMEKINGYF